MSQQVFLEITRQTIYESYALNTHGVTLNRSLWLHNHGWFFFPGTAYARGSSDIKFHNLFDLQGRNWKTLFMDIHLYNLCHWSRRRARGLFFFRTRTGCIFPLRLLFSLTILLRYFHKRLGRRLKLRRVLNFRTRYFFSSSRLQCDGNLLRWTGHYYTKGFTET